MQNDSEILETLILGGILGAALSALVSPKNEVSVTGSIAGAVILASFKAYENAQKTGLPVIIEEKNALYRIYPDGRKEFIKQLPRITTSVPEKFILR